MLHCRALRTAFVGALLFALDGSSSIVASPVLSGSNHLVARDNSTSVPVRVPLRSPSSAVTVTRNLVAFSLEGEFPSSIAEQTRFLILSTLANEQ